MQLCRQQDETLMVLHDLPTGAMDRLELFIRQAKNEGFVFIQDFPKNCVPVERGILQHSMDALVTAD
jgi:hypothetical protein